MTEYKFSLIGVLNFSLKLHNSAWLVGTFAMVLAFCCHFTEKISGLKYPKMQISRDASVDNFFFPLKLQLCSSSLELCFLNYCWIFF